MKTFTILKNKIVLKEEWMVGFITTWIVGLLAHAYRFFNFLPIYAFFNAFITKVFAGLYNLLLDPLYPFASFNTFLCFLRAFIAPLTLAMSMTSLCFLSIFYFVFVPNPF